MAGAGSGVDCTYHVEQSKNRLICCPHHSYCQFVFSMAVMGLGVWFMGISLTKICGPELSPTLRFMGILTCTTIYE